MKLGLLALFSIGIALLLGRPTPTEMQIVSEGLTVCGYECNLYDGLLGADETLTWDARGDLLPGESYTYTWQPTSGPREIVAYAAASKGYRADLQVVITASVETGIGVQEYRAEGIGRACVYWNWSQAVNSPWQVTVTNVDTKAARAVYFQGTNRMQIGESCVGWR